MVDKLIEYISQFIPIGKEEIMVISSMVEVKEYKKGHTLLEEGMISRVSYFNLQGCVRLYYLVDGEEKTTFFFTENQFIASMRSFIKQKPSDHFLQCVEDCKLALIPYEVEKKLLEEYPKLESFARAILEEELVSCQASNNVQSGVSFAGSLRCKKTYVAMAMLVFCALTSHKIYDRLTRHLRLDTTLGNYQEMLASYIISNPEQRYLNLMKNAPGLLQRVPQYQLASYIGIKAESLSRIRNRLVKSTS